jgi:hypothetical protein
VHLSKASQYLQRSKNSGDELMDNELFRKLLKQGLISVEPSEMWMPMETKDNKWQNYYVGQNRITMHLSGGWMINPDTFELKQIEIHEADYSPQNISSYITDIARYDPNVESSLIESIQSVFDQLGYEYETIDDDFGQAIVVRHKFSILGNEAPLTLKFSEYGFDPKKTMNHVFEQKLHSVLPNLFKVNIIHVPEFDDDGEELSTFGETGLEFTTEINQPITVNNFPDYLESRRKEIDMVLNELQEYRFDDEPTIKQQQFYPLKYALDSDEYKNAEGSLLFPIGKDDSGKFVIADLHKLPHIMAAGQTGSGKSNFTEGVLILSLLYRCSPDDLKLVLIDPKCVQFMQYNGIPHLQRPVITTPEESKDTIEWLLKELDDRFTTLLKNKAKNIEEYNSSGKGHMPFIVLVVDEVSDLMMVDGEYYQKSFIRLLQQSAAVGIHIYIGTSRPSEDVLPSLLRANFVTKIAFRTASVIDSKAIIDTSGAEQLLGRGDLLFSSLDNQTPIHLQAPYVSEVDMMKVIDSLKD